MGTLRILLAADEVEFAFSERQLRNHALHAGIGLVVYGLLRWGAGLLPLSALVAVIAVAGVKEWAELIRKHLRGRYVHALDSILDFMGWWLLPAIITLWS